jgi:hypothetical protein
MDGHLEPRRIYLRLVLLDCSRILSEDDDAKSNRSVASLVSFACTELALMATGELLRLLDLMEGLATVMMNEAVVVAVGVSRKCGRAVCFVKRPKSGQSHQLFVGK